MADINMIFLLILSQQHGTILQLCNALLIFASGLHDMILIKIFAYFWFLANLNGRYSTLELQVECHQLLLRTIQSSIISLDYFIITKTSHNTMYIVNIDHHYKYVTIFSHRNSCYTACENQPSQKSQNTHSTVPTVQQRVILITEE